MGATPMAENVRVAQVLSLAQEGLNTQQIADRLGLKADRVQYLARLAGVPLPGTAGDRAARDARLRQLALDGFTSFEIAATLGHTPSHVRRLARERGIEIVADVVNGRARRRLDSTRVVSKTIEQLDGIGTLFDQIDYGALPKSEITSWLDTLDESLSALLVLRRRLKEAQL